MREDVREALETARSAGDDLDRRRLRRRGSTEEHPTRSLAEVRALVLSVVRNLPEEMSVRELMVELES